MRRPQHAALLLLTILGCAAATGCAVRPGYADSATGRVYAGFAKPAFYPSDLLHYRDCDACRPPYVAPVAAFSPWGCVKYANGCRPPLATTEVYAPPIARYEDYPDNPGFRPRAPRPSRTVPEGPDGDAVRGDRLRGEVVPAPAPVPLEDFRGGRYAVPAPLEVPAPLIDRGDDPLGRGPEFDVDADAARPSLPSMEVEPDGVGVE